MTRWLLDFPIADIFDIALVAVLLWAGIHWLRRTPARLAVAGIAILGAIYLVARRLQLQLTAWILQGFFAVFVVIVVVVFQEDLRRLFERLAMWGLRWRARVSAPGSRDALVRAAGRLAAARTGALIVLPGRESIERHLQGGVPLDARVSEPLLLSLFDPSSPGHDGAVVVAGDRATRFAVHLPLATDLLSLGSRGTRHSAALGLSERTDALCIAVSEESGSISVARDGRLVPVAGAEALAGQIDDFVRSVSPEQTARGGVWRGLVRSWPEALLAGALTVTLWVLLVPGARLVRVERSVPVTVENLPEGWVLEAVEPSEVKVTATGARRVLYLTDPATFEVRVDAVLAQLGRRTFTLTPAEVEHPDGVKVVDVRPQRVRISLRRENGQPPEAEP